MGDELLPKLKYNSQTDSEKVPWGNDEKNSLYRRVKRSWNCQRLSKPWLVKLKMLELSRDFIVEEGQ